MAAGPKAPPPEMPRMQEADLRISPDAARQLACRAFTTLGVPTPVAEDAAGVLVCAEMMGITTHGLNRVASYGARLAGGGIDPAGHITVSRIAPALVQVDGGNALGPAVACRALDAAMDAARETGAGVALCRQSNHFGAAAPYCLRACEAGFALMVMSNTTPLLAPAGGRVAAVGNNPLGLGFPAADGRHMIVDMALSVVSRSRIRRAAQTGDPIPEGWATDADGQPTTDAGAAMRGVLQGIGGHKGYGLALGVEMLAGVWSGAAFLTQIADLSRDEADGTPVRQDLGQAFIVLDLARFQPDGAGAARMAQARDLLTATPPASPDAPVRLPGDRALAHLARARAEGLCVAAHTLAALRNMAGAEGI
jgi:LDH2 family malate/lactate/ureidoglycolate dehydrogenase